MSIPERYEDASEVVAITVPLALVERSPEVTPLIPSWVVVEYVAKTWVEVMAVEEAYGNWDASVDEEKNEPWVQIEVFVAEVVVPKVFATVKRLANEAAVESVAQPKEPLDQVRYCPAEQPPRPFANKSEVEAYAVEIPVEEA